MNTSFKNFSKSSRDLAQCFLNNIPNIPLEIIPGIPYIGKFFEVSQGIFSRILKKIFHGFTRKLPSGIVLQLPPWMPSESRLKFLQKFTKTNLLKNLVLIASEISSDRLSGCTRFPHKFLQVSH